MRLKFFLALFGLFTILLATANVRTMFIHKLQQMTVENTFELPPTPLPQDVITFELPPTPLPQDVINCTSQAPFKEIIIKGERHHGTNWITALLEQNVPRMRVNQQGLDIGWKHGFLPPQGWGRPLERTDLLLVVTRDVFTWLPKMQSASYDPEQDKYKKMPFHDFIMRPYKARCQPIQKAPKNGRSKYQKEFCKSLADYEIPDNKNMDKSVSQIVAENATNLIQIRTQKYKNWLSDDPPVEVYHENSSKEIYMKNRIHIRVEDLTDESYSEIAKVRQRHALIEPLENHCVTVKNSFEPIVAKTKWDHVAHKKSKAVYNVEKERQMLLKKYSKKTLRFVLSQLDMEFEKKLGYNYDYVYEMLESDDVRE